LALEKKTKTRDKTILQIACLDQSIYFLLTLERDADFFHIIQL